MWLCFRGASLFIYFFRGFGFWRGQGASCGLQFWTTLDALHSVLELELLVPWLELRVRWERVVSSPRVQATSCVEVVARLWRTEDGTPLCLRRRRVSGVYLLLEAQQLVDTIHIFSRFSMRAFVLCPEPSRIGLVRLVGQPRAKA
jgi:hypothetical protein